MGRPAFTAGFAIVSADGMLANAHGIMPQELMFEADQVYFEAALDRYDVMVHGRNSQEPHRNAPARRRVIATRRIADVAPDAVNPKAVLWNPAGPPLQRALDLLGVPNATIAVIGGTDVFGLFLPLYDEFHLTKAGRVRSARWTSGVSRNPAAHAGRTAGETWFAGAGPADARCRQ